MAQPIWKDYFVTLGTGDSARFRIILQDLGQTIYTGTAYKRPGEENISVRINDICADYMQHTLPTLDNATFTRLSFPLTFSVQTIVNNRWTDRVIMQFYNDWSYDYDYNPETMGMSFPISRKVDVNMPIVWTAYNTEMVRADIHYKNGTSSFVLIPVAISNDFNADYNQDFSQSTAAAGSGTAVFFPSQWENVRSIELGGVTFEIVDACAKYALYYVNAYGGWDALMLEGNSMETDSLKRYTREVVYDNNDIVNRGVHNYVNEITKQFRVTTGWLLGDSGKMMHHLLNSTEVYLYDISEQQMIPVIIPSNSSEYRTFKNNGNRLVRYELNLQVAQNRIRR